MQWILTIHNRWFWIDCVLGEYVCAVQNTVGQDLTRAVVNVDAYTYVPDSEFSEVHSEDEVNVILEEDETGLVEEGGPQLEERLEPITSVHDGERVV